MTSSPERQAPGRTLAILGIGALSFVLAQTSVIPALPDIQQEIGASANDITWMVTAYLLVASIATPIFGRLGDMFGKERLLAVALASFSVGSIVCALSTSIEPMIVGRGLQGLGGGVFPLAFGIIRDEFPSNKIPTGIAVLGATAAIGSSIGLPLGGVLADGFGFAWIFWVSAIMGVLATVATHLFVPESPVRNPGRVDLRGALVLAIGLTALLIAISRGAQWGWGSVSTVGLIVAGLVVMGLFGALQRRTDDPLINMTTFARRPVLTTNIATMLLGIGMISMFVLVPQLAQLPEGGEVGFGLSTTEAGLLLVPGSLMSLLVAPIVGRVSERVGSKVPLLAGCVVTALALTGMALAHGSVALVVLWALIANVGIGATFAAIPNLILGFVDATETGEATGVNTIMRNIGGAIGAQVAGAIIAAHVLASGLPEDAGFTLAFFLGAAGAVLAALAVLLIPNPGVPGRNPAADVDTAKAAPAPAA